MDQRIKVLSHSLINSSLKVKAGENVLINISGFDTLDIGKALIAEVYAAGANPFIEIKDSSINRAVLLGANEDQLNTMLSYQLLEMQKMDSFVAVSSTDNVYELSDVPQEKLSLMNKILDPVLRERVDRTKWVILRYPNGSSAQNAKMSKEAFTDYYFDVCCVDYDKMAAAFVPLKELMERTDAVHIIGNGTDLSFSIKDIPVIPCAGECNIPDGEIFTAPIRDSVNGMITFNAPSLYNGTVFENICLEFKDGKIITASANNSVLLNKILDTDEGARYVGEFSLGVNPKVTSPILDTLFDEKIAGSFHFTPGAAYEEANNGNHSAIHWDMVCMHSDEYPGEIYFDNVLVRKNGVFVLPELEGLNPERLSF